MKLARYAAAAAVLSAVCTQRIPLTLSASAEDTSRFAPRELTGEEIVKLITDGGGKIDQVEYDSVTGEIVSLQASGNRPDDGGVFEYDPSEVEEILESLQATGVTPTKLVGDLAQTSVGTTFTFTASTTSASAVLTSPSSSAGLAIGTPITGTGIPVGATITILSPLTMSANATATGSAVVITAEGEVQVIGLGEWTIDWKRKTVDTTTTDSSTYESSLPSTASWSVKAKYMFIDGDPSQATYILSTLQSPTAPAPWNFFPTIATGRAGFQGLAYVDGITIGAGTGKVVGLDVSLKGTGPLTQLVQTAAVVNTNTTTGLQAEE